jgi:hypothetical protein
MIFCTINGKSHDNLGCYQNKIATIRLSNIYDAPMTGIDGAKILCLEVVPERLNGSLGSDCKKFGRAPGS